MARSGVEHRPQRAQFEQQGAAVGHGGRLVECAAQAGGRDLRRPACACGGGGLAQPRDRPRIAGRRGGEQVGGVLRRRHAVVVQQPCGGAVEPGTLRPAEFVEHDGADDRVPVGESAVVLEDVGAQQGGGHRGRGGHVDPGQRRRAPQIGACPEDRYRLGERGGCGRERRQPQQDAARDDLRRHMPDGRGGRRRGLDCIGAQVTRQLVQQERVAAGHLVAGTAQRVGGTLVVRLADERGAAGRAQRRRVQQRDGRRGRESAEQVPMAARLASRGTSRGEQQQREPLQARREVGEEAQRRLVAPMQVVDDEGQRRAFGKRDGQPVEAVDARERRLRVVVGRDGVRAEQRRGERRRAVERWRTVSARRA